MSSSHSSNHKADPLLDEIVYPYDGSRSLPWNVYKHLPGTRCHIQENKILFCHSRDKGITCCSRIFSGRAVQGVGLRQSSCWDCGVRIPPLARMSVSFERCVLADRGLLVRLITHPEEFYLVWSVWSWSLDNQDALAHLVGGWGELLHNKECGSLPRVLYTL